MDRPSCGQTRREFFRNIARHAAAGSLVAGISLLVLRSGSASADCVKSIQCGGCDVFGECGLPRALAARETSSAAPVSKG
jgi:hypothetical protein